MAVKTSILIFYLRLSKNTQKVLRLASYAVLGIVNVAGTVLTLINIFQCRPIAAAWDPMKGQLGAQCIPLLVEFICSAPVNVVTDLAILALPLPVLTGMRLPPRQKFILVITFLVGIFVTIVDVVRIYYLQQAITNVSTQSSSDPETIFGDSQDFSWNASLAFMWSAVEVNVGIICACVPTLKPLIIKILPAMIIDPDGTRASDSLQDKDSADRANRTSLHEDNVRRGTIIGAGGGLQAPPPTFSPGEHRESGPEDLTMLDFLTTPDMGNDGDATSNLNNRVTQQMTATTFNTRSSIQENSVYFGFVNMKRPRSMLRTSAMDSFKYCTVVATLFFLWGFTYGLLNTLNNVVAAVSNMSTPQTLGLTSAYFGFGYLFGPLLIGEWVLRHDEHHRYVRRNNKGTRRDESIGGFKATFIVGLCIYGIGTIMFWPSAVLASFPGFLTCNFVTGFGLAVLETAANPFLALCGPPDYAEMRLLLAQGVQGVASVLSGLMAQNLFFINIGSKGRTDALTLLEVQWTYLAITLVCAGLALLFYYMPLPEVTDRELAKAASQLPVDCKKRSVFGLQLRTICLILAVLAQWTYVAAQESMSIFFRSLMITLLANKVTSGPEAANNTTTHNDQSDQPDGLVVSIPNYLLVAHTAFALSRFLCGYLAYLSAKYPNNRFIPTPRTMLTTCAAGSVIFAVLTATVQPNNNPNLIAIPLVLYFFAEGPLWPLIFAMGLRGQGKRTKRASAWMTVGGSGPAFWPFVMYAIVNRGGTYQMAFIVVVVLLVFTLVYPLFLIFKKDARILSSPGSTHALSGTPEENGDEEFRFGEDPIGFTNDIVAQRRRTMSSCNDKSNGGVLDRISSHLGSRRSSKPRGGSSDSNTAADEQNEGAETLHLPKIPEGH